MTAPVTELAGVLESVAFTMMDAVPAAVGVPLSMQLLPKVRPAGRLPFTREQL